jgi:hypothetical protein
MTNSRIAPHNREAEEWALGSVLVDQRYAPRLLSDLAAEDFFVPAHREIFEAMRTLHATPGQVINVITVGDVLRLQDALPRLEGEEGYLMRLASAVTSPDFIEHYIRVIREHATKRAVILSSSLTLERAYSGTATGEELAAEMAANGVALAKAGRVRHWLTERFHTVGEKGLLKTKAPPREYLLLANGRGVLPAGRVGMVAAAGGAGKSWALSQLGVAVATGKDWLGSFSVNPSKRGRALLLFAEEEEDEFHRRLEFICRDLPAQHRVDVEDGIVPLALSGEDVELVKSGDRFDKSVLVETRTYRELMNLISEGGPWSLIVFDPLTRLGADVESDNGAAARMITLFEKFSHAPGRPTVLFAHHISKSSHQRGSLDATAARGASALSNNARWQGVLEPRQDFDGAPRLVDFKVVKSNYGGAGRSVVLASDPERDGMLVPATPNMIDTWLREKRRASAPGSGDGEGGDSKPLAISDRMRERA